MSLTAIDPAVQDTAPRPGGFWLTFKNMPQLYARRMLLRILLQLLMMMFLIEAIFLGERLTGILDSALQQSAELLDVLKLLIYTGPEVSDLALPIALLIAVYGITLRYREDREFLILAAAGIGAQQIIRMFTLLGAVALLFSLILSGFIDPYARYENREVLFTAKYRALRGGITPGQFYAFGSIVVYAPSQSTNTPERRVFIHQPQGETDRVIVANSARLEGPDEQGKLTLRLRDFTLDEFANPRQQTPPGTGFGSGALRPLNCADCPPIRGEPVRNLRIGSFAREMTIEELFRFDLRGTSPSEWTSLELLGLTNPPGPSSTAHANEIGRRLSRAMLCLIAPLLALVALTFTTARAQAFAMPLACGGLMVLDLLIVAAVKSISAFGFIWVLVLPLAIGGTSLIALIYFTLLRQHAVVKPGLGRP
jgi:lipopolysaccharide export LptBFGC system permease protein LptF